jgi:hypothetical protein
LLTLNQLAEFWGSLHIGGENKFEIIKYSFDELQDAVEEFKQVNLHLLKVWKELVDDYNSNHPNTPNSFIS